MGHLVSLGEAATHLGLAETDEALAALVDRIENLFVAECGRSETPFRAVQTGRTERLDGNGRSKIWVAYPITALTSIKLGYDSTDPDETLSVADKTKIVFDVGSRWIARVDGGVFGQQGQPSYVQVVYDAGDDLPQDAGLAILRGVAAVYNQRGSEDVKSESAGGYRADLAAVLADDPIWQRAVQMHRAVAV